MAPIRSIRSSIRPKDGQRFLQARLRCINSRAPPNRFSLPQRWLQFLADSSRLFAQGSSLLDCSAFARPRPVFVAPVCGSRHLRVAARVQRTQVLRISRWNMLHVPPSGGLGHRRSTASRIAKPIYLDASTRFTFFAHRGIRWYSW